MIPSLSSPPSISFQAMTRMQKHSRDDQSRARRTIEKSLIMKGSARAERLKRRVKYHLSDDQEIGLHEWHRELFSPFLRKMPGEPPDTLLSYFPRLRSRTGPHAKRVPDFLTIVDELSRDHTAIRMACSPRIFPQGDARGARLPITVAKDNRPLKFNEFLERVGPMIFTSATPSDYERKESQQIVEQVIRPTGLWIQRLRSGR